MSHLMIDYARADVWKQRAQAAAKAESLNRASVKAALAAMKAKGIQASPLANKARLANEAAVQAAAEAEKVWADTATNLQEQTK